MRLLRGYGLRPQNGGDTVRRSNRIYRKTEGVFQRSYTAALSTATPRNAKAQTVIEKWFLIFPRAVLWLRIFFIYQQTHLPAHKIEELSADAEYIFIMRFEKFGTILIFIIKEVSLWIQAIVARIRAVEVCAYILMDLLS